MTEIFLITMTVLLLLNVPIAVSIGIASVVVIIIKDLPIVLIAHQMFQAVDSFTLLAIPFFLLAGNLMSYGGISIRIVKFADSLVGFIRGGLAMVTVIACMFFAGISGASTADTAAIGSIMIPAMIKQGYDRDFSAALVASAGLMGSLIPPSIVFILYGVIANVSIGELFLAGVIPGLLIGLSLMLLCYIFATKRNYPKGNVPSLKEIFYSGRKATLPMFTPFIILGGIIFGVFTPTESAVVAVIYGLILGLLVYKELKLKDMKDILFQSVFSSAQVMWILAAATLSAWLIIAENIPGTIANSILSMTQNKYLILALINVVLFLAGTFLDPPPAMILLVPVLLPIADQIGIDPIHFGIIVTVNLVIGMITPPSAPCLMIVASISKSSLGKLSITILPFMFVQILVLIIVTYFPKVFMWLPLLYRAYTQ